MSQVLKTILVTPAQAEWLDAQAKALSISVSAFIRQVIERQRTSSAEEQAQEHAA